MINSPIPLTEIDWDAYWEHFKAIHGEHIEYEGKLLFPDGWRYSSTDPSGPEYPPEDEKARRRWIKVYWKQRLSYCVKEQKELSAQYVGLQKLAEVRSAPIFQREYSLDDNGDLVSEAVPLDLEMYRGRMEWLIQDMQRCQSVIEILDSPDFHSFPERERAIEEQIGASYA